MGKLFIIFDTETKQFSGGSIGAKYLSGIGSVVLNRDGARVLDFEGRDLLAAAGESAGPVKTRSSVEQDIAACFGAAGDAAAAPAHKGDEPVDGFGNWGRARGSL